MARKLWTADELQRMTPAEQDAIFGASIVANLADVPADFLARVRLRLEHRLAERDTPNSP